MTLSTRASLLFHTVRYLKPVQVYGRVWFGLYRPPAPKAVRHSRRGQNGNWQRPAARRASMIGPDAFRFLNVEGATDGWQPAQRARLWQYNLHYFDDLSALDGDQRSNWHHRLIARWIAENPAPEGVGWEPYPLSLRIVNWIKWALGGHRLDDDALTSLAIQAGYLAKRVEWHLLGNHLIANAKALIFAGVFLEGAPADQWVRRALHILNRQLDEQVMADGGHFERSAMYHAIVLEDICDLINLAGAFPGVVDQASVNAWRHTAQRMIAWDRAMRHPDGGIAFFNDAAHAIAVELGEQQAYEARLNLGSRPGPDDAMQRPRIGVVNLEGSGYVRMQAGDAVVLCDTAPVGPDYLPGHGHADSLSFELSIGTERVIVNSGTSRYGTGRQRAHERSTRAHSTVVVDDENSSEVWAGFRVARRARPFGLEISQGNDQAVVTCSHDGYHRLAGRVTHTRRWTLTERSLSIGDRLSGRFERATARVHFHPGVAFSSGCDTMVASLASRTRIAVKVIGGQAVIAQGRYHREFGLSEANECLDVRFSGLELTTVLRW